MGRLQWRAPKAIGVGCYEEIQMFVVYFKRKASRSKMGGADDESIFLAYETRGTLDAS